MRILTLDNVVYPINNLPDEVDDLRFCILDNSDPSDPDYFFIPLIFLESFNSPAAVLRIGENKIQIPLDWHILIGDPEVGDLEVMPVTSINDRGFSAFTYNPLSSFKPEFMSVDIVNVYSDIKWYFPKLKNGQLLAMPLTDDPKPPCAYFIKDYSKQQGIIDVRKVW
jgi:hypothetical protein